ncbi:MAG: hypothetical protein N2Z72_04785 [Bacteroidales bacterium]|nr:hypothetical protein [Bacteroidales bacterium]
MEVESIEWLWVLVGLIFLLFSVVGLFNKRIPVIPFAFLSLLILQLKSEPPFSVELLILLFFAGFLVMWLDYQVYQFVEKYPFLYYIIKGVRISFFLFLCSLYVYGIFQ